MQIENYKTTKTNAISIVNNLESIEENDVGIDKSAKYQYDIITTGMKKVPAKTPKAYANGVRKTGGYLETIMQNKDNHKIKRQLNLISQMTDYENIDYPNFKTEGNDEELQKEKKEKIKESISNKLVGKNNTKIRKVVDQTSSLFDTDFYNTNCSSILKK